MVVKVDVTGPLAVGSDKVGIARRPLILCIAGQHALQTHADTLDVLNRAPALRPEQVEANNAIGVDMRVHRDRPIGELEKHDFWWLYSAVSKGVR